MAAVDGVDGVPSGNSPPQDHFPTTLEPYLGAVLVRALSIIRSLFLKFLFDQLAGKLFLWSGM
jgi:hypothetical protein